MGDRGHIAIEQRNSDTPVVLYTHWHASSLPTLLARALAKQARWNDEEYLARIIFDEISDAASETTGAGIGTELHGDAWRVLTVDAEPDGGRICFFEGHGYHDDEHADEEYTFEEFLEAFGPSPEW